jgi:ketosteroid isomerase-like protein
MESAEGAVEGRTGGRTVEQRIATRWPGLAQRTTASVLRLPRGSRLRHSLLERSARAGYEAWNRVDLEPARAYADPEIEVRPAQGTASPVGMDDVYYGPDGYCRAMEEWAGAWRNWRVEVEDVIEVAANKVLVTARHTGEGRSSGAELEQWGAVLYTFRRGKILRVDGYLFSDRDSVSELVSSIAEEGVDAGAGTSARR